MGRSNYIGSLRFQTRQGVFFLHIVLGYSLKYTKAERVIALYNHCTRESYSIVQENLQVVGIAL